MRTWERVRCTALFPPRFSSQDLLSREIKHTQAIGADMKTFNCGSLIGICLQLLSIVKCFKHISSGVDWIRLLLESYSRPTRKLAERALRKEADGGFGHTVIRSPLSSPTHTLTTSTDTTMHYMVTCILSDCQALDIQRLNAVPHNCFRQCSIPAWHT